MAGGRGRLSELLGRLFRALNAVSRQREIKVTRSKFRHGIIKIGNSFQVTAGAFEIHIIKRVCNFFGRLQARKKKSPSMSQFRASTSLHDQQQARQFAELKDWIGDTLDSPLDEKGALMVRQVLAFTIDMRDYDVTARTFNDTRPGDSAIENRKLALWIFAYICEAGYMRTMYPKLRPVVDDESDDEEYSSGKRAAKRAKKQKRKKRKAASDNEDEHSEAEEDDDFDFEQEQREIEEQNLQAKLREKIRKAQERDGLLQEQCRKFNVFIDDLLESDDITARARILADRLHERITGEDIEPPRHWCAIEFIPSNECDNSDHRYLADIFSSGDKFCAYNQFQSPPQPCNWTFYFLTTSHHNFTAELSKLLFDNMMTGMRQADSGVTLTQAQKNQIQRQMSYRVVESDENLEKALLLIEGRKRGEKRKRGAHKKEIEAPSPKSKQGLQKNERERFPWRSIEEVGPSEFANIASSYLGVPVHKFYEEHNWSNRPVCPADSPLDANNLFSQATAVSCRSVNASYKQSLVFFANNRVYFKPNPSYESPDPKSRGLYRWRPPHPKRLLWFAPNTMTAVILSQRHFPDRLSLKSNPILELYPRLSKSMTMLETPLSLEHTPNLREGSTKPGVVSGRTYQNLALLKAKIQASEIAEQLATSSQPLRGDLFSEPELEIAKQEAKRMAQEIQATEQWRRAFSSVMSDFATRSRIFSEDLVRFTAAQPENRIRFLEAGSAFQPLQTRAPFNLLRYLKENNSASMEHEAYNILVTKTKAFLSQLRLLLQNKENSLTAKERYCIYKIYQKTMIHQWKMNARGSRAKLPDAARAVYTFIEEKDIYNPENRPRQPAREFDPEMNILSNMMARFLLHYRSTLSAARPDLLQMANIAALDSSRHEYNIHLSPVLIGKAGGSKSWTFVMMCQLRIPGTYRESTNETTAANSTNSGARLNYLVHVYHEMRRKIFFGDGEDNTGDYAMKVLLDRQVIVTQASQWSAGTGDWQETIRVAERIGCVMGCTNLILSGMDTSMFDRLVVINMPPGEMILTALLGEHLKQVEGQKNYESQVYTHRWLQAVVHELWAMLGLELAPPPTTVLLFIAMHFINEKMVSAGFRPFRPREVLKIKLHACILMLLDVIAGNVLVDGGRFSTKQIDPECLVALGPQLYLTSNHVIQSVLSFAPHFTSDGEDHLRSALFEFAKKKKARSGSASICYAKLSPDTFGGKQNFDWDRHSFHFYPDELLALVRSRSGGENFTRADLDRSIRVLSERTITSAPYARAENSLDSDEPILSVATEGHSCPCWVGMESACVKHGKMTLPIIERSFNGAQEILLVSTAWLLQKEKCSANAVIEKALREFFDRRHQPSLKCVGGYSEKYPGTFEVFKIDAPLENDTREPLTVPNIHKLSSPEYAIMHSKLESKDVMEDEQPFFANPYHTADMFEITEQYDLYASLERQDSMYFCRERVTERDLVRTLYTFGEKLGLTGSGFSFDPNDPLLQRYDDTEDIDFPIAEHLVPSVDDPTIRVPLWEEMGISFEEYKRTAFTPQCLEFRLRLFQQLEKEPLSYDYPDDARCQLAKSEKERAQKPVVIPLSHQLSTKGEELSQLRHTQYSLGRKQAALRKKIFPNRFSKENNSARHLAAEHPEIQEMEVVRDDFGHSAEEFRNPNLVHDDSLVPVNLMSSLDSIFDGLAKVKTKNL